MKNNNKFTNPKKYQKQNIKSKRNNKNKNKSRKKPRQNGGSATGESATGESKVVNAIKEMAESRLVHKSNGELTPEQMRQNQLIERTQQLMKLQEEAQSKVKTDEERNKAREEFINYMGSALTVIGDPITYFIYIGTYALLSIFPAMAYPFLQIANVGDTPLENIIPFGPKQCKTIFNDAKICKSKVKTLFGSTEPNYLTDLAGSMEYYKEMSALEEEKIQNEKMKSRQKGGSKNKTAKNHKSNRNKTLKVSRQINHLNKNILKGLPNRVANYIDCKYGLIKGGNDGSDNTTIVNKYNVEENNSQEPINNYIKQTEKTKRQIEENSLPKFTGKDIIKHTKNIENVVSSGSEIAGQAIGEVSDAAVSVTSAATGALTPAVTNALTSIKVPPIASQATNSIKSLIKGSTGRKVMAGLRTARTGLKIAGTPGVDIIVANLINKLLDEPSKRVDQSTCIHKVYDKEFEPYSSSRMCNTSHYVNYNQLGGNDKIENNETKDNETEQSPFTVKSELKPIPESALFYRQSLDPSIKQLERLLYASKLPLSVVSAKSGKKDKDSAPGDFIFTDNNRIKDILNKHFETKTLYNMILLYKMLDILFGDETKTEEIMNYYKNATPPTDSVKIQSPWDTKSYMVSPFERIICLWKNLTTSDLGEDYNASKGSLEERCFVCRECTTLGTVKKAFSKPWFASTAQHDLNNAFNSLTDSLESFFTFKLLPPDRFYMLSILSGAIYQPFINLSQINFAIKDHLGNVYSMKDLVIGIPVIRKRNVSIPENFYPHLKKVYLLLKMLNVDTRLHNIYIKRVYEETYKKEGLDNIKEECPEKLTNKLVVLKKIIDNAYINIYNKPITDFPYCNNDININDIKYFNDLFTSLPNVKDYVEYEFVSSVTPGVIQLRNQVRDKMKELAPLYTVILDGYVRDIEYIKSHSDEHIRQFVSIVEKIKEVEKTMKTE